MRDYWEGRLGREQQGKGRQEGCSATRPTILAVMVTGFVSRLSLSNHSDSGLFLVAYASSVQFTSVTQSCLFATPWTVAPQASLSINNSWSLLKLMSIESVMPFNNLILCRPLLLLPPIPPSIRVFSTSSHELAKVLEFQLQHQSFQ